MKKIAKIINNLISNVSIGDENYLLKSDEMFLENALRDGFLFQEKQILKIGCRILPEDFYLSDENSDEIEFNKLLSLCTLGINQNVLTETSIIKIKDLSGIIHEISIKRFFEIMVQYGLHCYNNRNY